MVSGSSRRNQQLQMLSAWTIWDRNPNTPMIRGSLNSAGLNRCFGQVVADTGAEWCYQRPSTKRARYLRDRPFFGRLFSYQLCGDAELVSTLANQESGTSKLQRTSKTLKILRPFLANSCGKEPRLSLRKPSFQLSLA